MRSEWEFREREEFLTLGTGKSPLYIQVGVCKTVVRHTCARRLQILRKSNRRGETRGSHDGDRYCSFDRVSFTLSTPSRRFHVLRVKLPNAEFGLGLYWA
ncbi:hypothetical protein MtrunA17_Chr4g0012161 [Medicago truncatula]|uniref:Uncharacterized protein n=1 Tax=Medicago truncatula TaxID=3880 RepID=A0A396I903_MEDTR|nr:hypothetical protein MtrunA17_Chr4g0012161 [Medicago truncatula]